MTTHMVHVSHLKPSLCFWSPPWDLNSSVWCCRSLWAHASLSIQKVSHLLCWRLQAASDIVCMMTKKMGLTQQTWTWANLEITFSYVYYYVLLCKLDTCMHNLSCKFLSDAAAFQSTVNLCLYQHATASKWSWSLRWLFTRYRLNFSVCAPKRVRGYSEYVACKFILSWKGMEDVIC